MTRTERISRNPRLLFWAKTCVNFKSLNAIITLFYLHRGLTLAQVVWLSAVFGGVTLLAEIPSGYLADRLGRKRTLGLGVLFLLASSVIHWSAYGFPAFVVALAFLALAGACFSGTEEALLYDSLLEIGQEKTMLRQNSRLLSAQNFPKIFLPPLGALVAHGLTDAQFHVLIGLDLAGGIAALILLGLVTEPRGRTVVAGLERGIFRESVETIRTQPDLFYAALNKIVPVVAGMLLWRIYQPYLLGHGVSVSVLGLFYLAMHSAMFSLRWAAEATERRFGSARVLNVTALCMTVFAAVAAFVSSSVSLFACFSLFFVFGSLREPMYAHWIHRQIRSRSRATTLSNLNVFRSVLDLPVMWVGGVLAARDPRLAFALVAALCLSALVFFPIRRQDTGDL